MIYYSSVGAEMWGDEYRASGVRAELLRRKGWWNLLYLWTSLPEAVAVCQRDREVSFPVDRTRLLWTPPAIGLDGGEQEPD